MQVIDLVQELQRRIRREPAIQYIPVRDSLFEDVTGIEIRHLIGGRYLAIVTDDETNEGGDADHSETVKHED